MRNYLILILPLILFHMHPDLVAQQPDYLFIIEQAVQAPPAITPNRGCSE